MFAFAVLDLATTYFVSGGTNLHQSKGEPLSDRSAWQQ